MVDKVSDFLLFLGKMMVTLVTTLVGAILLQQPSAQIPGWDLPDVGRYWAVPLILIAILSYVVASCFMTLYEMAIDTMFLCFCKLSMEFVACSHLIPSGEDSERNDGTVGKPYYMPEGFKEFLDGSKKKTVAL